MLNNIASSKVQLSPCELTNPVVHAVTKDISHISDQSCIGAPRTYAIDMK